MTPQTTLLQGLEQGVIQPITDHQKLPVAANKAIVSNGNAQCSPTLVGLDNVASAKLVAPIYELGMTTKFPLLNLASCK
jgi:hypothetical protein